MVEEVETIPIEDYESVYGMARFSKPRIGLVDKLPIPTSSSFMCLRGEVCDSRFNHCNQLSTMRGGVRTWPRPQVRTSGRKDVIA
jgi:hypothetical protein